MFDINQIQTGDGLLVSSHSFLARQIQKFQKIQDEQGGKWNHAAVSWWAYDELMVIEADTRGIAITPFRDYLNSNRSLMRLIPQFYIDGSECGKFMLPYAGHTRYDKWNLIVAQAVKFLTFGKVWLGERKENDKKFICGEWAHFVWKQFRPDLFPEFSPKIAPVDLFLNKNFSHQIIKP